MTMLLITNVNYQNRMIGPDKRKASDTIPSAFPADKKKSSFSDVMLKVSTHVSKPVCRLINHFILLSTVRFYPGSLKEVE